MFRRLFQYIVLRIAGLRQDCQGFVVMSTLAIFLFLFLLCAFVYAVGETIHQRIKMQNACDAAAYSAAVVQADGLSRMAVVNRAMAWSYVQMTNRQMDYINYRWLKLTCKRFEEDQKNAEKYNANIIFAVDKELGWWALLEMALTGLVSELFDFDCSGKLGNDAVTVGHKKEGHGWWCGLEIGDRKSHNIRLNHPKNEDFWNTIKTAGIEAVTDQLSTLENLKSMLSVFRFWDSGTSDNAETWAAYLGKWIDYDKKNIYRMNRALARINKQMTISMRMTAESVLKAMLKDNRIDAKNVLKDYYITIHIPEAEDPYQNAEPRSAAPKSFFSPLHNTEAEEMLFLNMHSTEAVSKTLFQHFPTLLGGTELPYGLDQWFIRGTATYSDGKDHCYDASPLSSGISFVESADFHKATMIRKEGMLGIQRVYKDANLNETGAGFLAKERMKKVGEHQEQDVYHSKKFGRLPQCCKDACDYFNTHGSPNYYHIAKHDIYAKVPDEKHAVWRGNHLMDFMNVTNNLTNALSSFINTNNASGMTDEEKMAVLSGQGIPTTTVGISDEDGLKQQMEQIRQDNIANGGTGVDNSVGQQPETTSGANQDQNQAASAKGNGNVLLNALSGAISNMIGNFLDVHPSCENDPKLVYDRHPSCQTINKGTTALYSEYRWASCKWYCLTKGYTYMVCILFGKDIYCDYPPADMKVSFLGISFKVRVQGFCHVGWPKWFCGHSPHKLLLDIIPPLCFDSISGAKHGYMDNPLDFGPDGFLRPLKTLWGDEKDRTFSRQKFESCAIFPDGLDNIPILGHFTWPGLLRGHARIYGDDKEICDNRYVGAKCQPWVLNERFFAGDGTIIVGAAMKHVNPLVQLFNFWNTKAEGDEKDKTYTTGKETQADAERTVLSAFNIPKKNYMWTMSAARAGVRHRRRDGAYDQARQYQITYDSTSDAENLTYSSGPYVFNEDEKRWTSPDEWGSAHQDNPMALTRIHRPVQDQKQENVPIWNGCPCASNEPLFRNLWNLCETDWDATLIPVRYAGQKAQLYLSKGSGGDLEGLPFNKQDYDGRRELIGIHIIDKENYSNVNEQNEKEKNDMVIGNGKNWMWNDVINNTSTLLTNNPFIHANWKPADNDYFSVENLFYSIIPEEISTGLSLLQGLNLNNKIPTGKEEKTVDVFTIFRDKVL